MSIAYLSLGCNRGQCRANLSWAIRLLDANERIEVTGISSVYETEPVGGVEQPDFLNMAVELTTDLTPQELLAACRAVEVDLGGRDNRRPMGPRTIDLDILLFEQVEIAEKELTLPHPEMLRRAFVLVPLNEIAPEAKLPQGGTVAEALARLEDGHAVKPAGKLF